MNILDTQSDNARLEHLVGGYLIVQRDKRNILQD